MRANIVLEDVPDPEAPNRTIRRAHRVDPLIRILGDGQKDIRRWPIDNQERYYAAERYRDTLAIAAGARPPPSETRSPAPSGLCADDVRVQAVSRVRAAVARLTAGQRDVVHWVVVGGMSIAYTARVRQCGHAAVRRDLIDGLDAWRA